MEQELFDQSHCDLCAGGAGLDFDFSFAFQPVVDAADATVLAHEALVRGLNGEGAGEVLSRITRENMYRFDQACRVKAVKLASELGMDTDLCINFMPNAVYRPETCIQTTLAAARRFEFDTNRLVFEFTEVENLAETGHLISIIDAYAEMGFAIALDDYGAGYSRMNLLTDSTPQYVKLDMSLIRDVHQHPRKQAVIEGVLLTNHRLGIATIAEGVETEAEYRLCRRMGIRYFQGFLLARPGFETLPDPYIPSDY